MTIEIELIPTANLTSIIPLIQQLNPNVPEATLRARLTEMVDQGYQCVGLYFDGKLIGICGLWIITKFYVGKHIEPDNVFILPAYRRQGLGKRLLAWLYDYGKKQGCLASELNCYVANESGNIFWGREGFAKIGYHYQRLFDLDDNDSP
jgi:GNAT superfamily N-acetyltransferase